MKTSLTEDLRQMIQKVQDLNGMEGARRVTLDQNLCYILECLGPMLLDLKPAELLTIGRLEQASWEDFKAVLTRKTEIGLIEIRNLNHRRQVLFYHRNVLSERLNQPLIQLFLQKLNYPTLFSLDGYLDYLIRKIRYEAFPHEIGIFLGYPLKDVWGFMGIVPLPYIKTQGWRVYGNEKLSDVWYDKYQQARQLMSGVLYR